MSVITPHPTDDDFASAYSKAWTTDPDHVVEFFASDGSYTDVAMGMTYAGRDGILQFHRWMLKFSPDSVIRFYNAVAQDGLAYLEWSWSGSINGPLRLPSGQKLDAAGKHFDATGIAACRYNGDGKLTSHRDFWDVGLLVDQLGHKLITTETGTVAAR